jgi:hypothetical protein
MIKRKAKYYEDLDHQALNLKSIVAITTEVDLTLIGIFKAE